MAQVNMPKFIQLLRQHHTGLLAEGQRKQDTILRISPEDAERLLTAALVKACQELMENGHIVDDSRFQREEEEARKAIH